MIRAILAALSVLIMPAPASAPPAAGPVVRIDTGLVRGVDGDGYRTFSGVPFAAPPVGALRWRSPQPAAAWPGVRDATTPHAECAQNTITGTQAGVEDCLYLNVTAPAGPRRNRPVLVFVHGGSFQNGSANDYDPHRLAVQGGLVVVTIEYRLGVFGFYGLPGLAGSGTFGLQDQQAALRWVRRNAAAFGGDPHNVTLDGESAGGMSVCAQMTSPTGSGLFQKAVIESGSCLVDWPQGFFLTGIAKGSQFSDLATVDVSGSTLAGATFGCSTVACMRAQDQASLLSATTGTGVKAFITPAWGTAVLPEQPAAAIRAGHYRRMPVLTGSNLDEHRGFLGWADIYGGITAEDYSAALNSAFGSEAGRVAAAYPVSAYGTPALAWAAAATDRIWACPTAAEDRLFAGRLPVWGYEFAERDGPAYSDGYPWGAAHGYELPYLFDMTVWVGTAQPSLSTEMVDAWSRFAATGSPGGPGSDAWPRMRGGRPYVKTLAVGQSGGVNLNAEHRCDFWATVPDA